MTYTLQRQRFRFWHKTSKKYIKPYEKEFYFNSKGMIVCALGLNSYVIEQCTGQKDKNGKLIYEGDIIKCGNDERFIYKVGFNKRFASFVLIRKKDFFNHYFGEAVEVEDIEVIGNIRENKDLLEEQSDE